MIEEHKNQLWPFNIKDSLIESTLGINLGVVSKDHSGKFVDSSAQEHGSKGVLGLIVCLIGHYFIESCYRVSSARTETCDERFHEDFCASFRCTEVFIIDGDEVLIGRADLATLVSRNDFTSRAANAFNEEVIPEASFEGFYLNRNLLSLRRLPVLGVVSTTAQEEKNAKELHNFDLKNRMIRSE